MRTAASDKHISLQPRDVALIRMLAEEFRILTGEQIGELFPMGSVQRRNFRLKQLRDARFLSSRTLMRMGNASKPGYYLGPRAPELFTDPTERNVANGIRAQVAQLAESGLAHRMLVDSIHIRFLTAIREYPNYRLLTWIDQYSSWWKEFQAYGIPIQADGYGEYLMLLHFENLFTFFLEVDRGTEGGQTLQDKIDRYIDYAESGLYEKQFAARPFRVLVVTTTERRMEALLDIMAARSTNLFWVTTWERFKSSKLLDSYWRRSASDAQCYSLLSNV
jgi:hypothetical protein